MTDLETRLADLGDHLDVDDEHLVHDVLAQLRSRKDRTPWLKAAAVIAVVVSAVIAVPDARRAVADWFGFGAITIDRLPDDAIERADATFALAGPGDSTIEIIDGREILVSQFDARLSRPLLTKSIGTSTNIINVDVDGQPAIWIEAGPHEIFYETDDGVGVARTAGQTLLWQTDGVVNRVEGFSDLETALEFAATLASARD